MDTVDRLIQHPEGLIFAAIFIGLAGVGSTTLLVWAVKSLFKRGTPDQLEAENTGKILDIAREGIDLKDAVIGVAATVESAIGPISEAIVQQANTQKSAQATMDKVIEIASGIQTQQAQFAGLLELHVKRTGEFNQDIIHHLETVDKRFEGMVEDAQKKIAKLLSEIELRVLAIRVSAETPEQLEKASEQLALHALGAGIQAKAGTAPLVINEVIAAAFEAAESKDKVSSPQGEDE